MWISSGKGGESEDLVSRWRGKESAAHVHQSARRKGTFRRPVAKVAAPLKGGKKKKKKPLEREKRNIFRPHTAGKKKRGPSAAGKGSSSAPLKKKGGKKRFVAQKKERVFPSLAGALKGKKAFPHTRSDGGKNTLTTKKKEKNTPHRQECFFSVGCHEKGGKKIKGHADVTRRKEKCSFEEGRPLLLLTPGVRMRSRSGHKIDEKRKTGNGWPSRGEKSLPWEGREGGGKYGKLIRERGGESTVQPWKVPIRQGGKKQKN